MENQQKMYSIKTSESCYDILKRKGIPLRSFEYSIFNNKILITCAAKIYHSYQKDVSFYRIE